MSAAAKVDEAEMSLAAFGSPSEGCGELDRQANARRVPLDLARPAARRAIESRIALASEARLRVVEGVAVKIDKKQARALVERDRKSVV